MSHVLDIRRRTAQERLRNDHIDLLYQLESLSKENTQLLNSIQQLEQQLELLATKPSPHPHPQVELESGAADDKNKYLKLQNDYQLLENKLKTINTTMSINDQMTRRQQREEIELYERELRMKEQLVQEMEMMSFEDCQGMRRRDSERYQQVIQDQEKLIADLNQRIQSVRGERDGEGEKEALAVMTKKNYGLQINFENLNQKYFNLKSAYQKLELHCQETSSQLHHSQSLLSQQVTPLSQQVQLIDNSCQTDPTPTNSLVEELESGFDDFDMRSITTADTAHPPSYGDQEEGEASSPRGSKGSPNFSFQEYIRLKRENLSLRVMLANTTNSNSNQRVASVSRASSLQPSVPNSYHHPPTHPHSASSMNTKQRAANNGRMTGNGSGSKKLSLR